MATNLQNKFLIPAIFLLILGFGNIIIGNFKYEQYGELLLKIEKQITEEPSKNLSPIQKLKYSNQYSPKAIALKKKAEARRDFYTLVSFSGKIFLTISSVLFLGFFIVIYQRD